MRQNILTQRFQNYQVQPIPYMNNQMLNNNPIFSSNIHDQSFYQRMMLQKDEYMRKIKNISDLNLTKEQITEYVIAPIKVEKSDNNEIKKLIHDEEQILTQKFIEDNWWSQRTNAPYKNILKDIDWTRDFKTQNDLVVHKYGDLDKVGLMKEYEELAKIIENHNGKLKVIFSASKKSEHKKAFKFVQKYRGKLKYNPKDYNELKDNFDKEQKKFDREQKRIDNILSRIMDDDIEDKEIKQLESEFLKKSSKVNKKSKSKIKDREIELDRQIQKLVDELGNEILKELEQDITDSDESLEDENNSSSSKSSKSSKNSDKKYNNKKDNKTKLKNADIDNSVENISSLPTTRIRIKKITKDNNSSENIESDSISIKNEKRIRIRRIEKDNNESNKKMETIDTTIKRIKIGKRSQITQN